MRSNFDELPGLGRLAAQLGATFIIVSNVLAYTEDLLGETLYDHPFRDRVRRCDLPPCTDCACELAERNEEDCLGNLRPVCGDCLWARGVVRSA